MTKKSDFNGKEHHDGNPFTEWIGALGNGSAVPDGTAAAWVREMREDREEESTPSND